MEEVKLKTCNICSDLILTLKSDMERICDTCSDIEKERPSCGLELCDDGFEMCFFCRGQRVVGLI